MAKRTKSFADAIDAEVQATTGPNNVFANIVSADTLNEDPMSALLKQTSPYQVPDDEAPPKVKVEKVAEDNSVSDEEIDLNPELLLQRNRELESGKPAPAAQKNQVPPTAARNPTPFQGNTPPFAEGSTGAAPPDTYEGEAYPGEPIYIDPERSNARRRVVSKFSGKFINDIIGTVSTVAHQQFVAPKAAIKEQAELMSRISTLSSGEQQRLQEVSAVVNDYMECKGNFAEKARMDDEDLRELQDCINDVMTTEEMNMHPGWLIVIIVGFHLLGNMVGIFFDRFKFRK